MIPAHLRPYVVKQNYDRYTALDQAVWRFIMRQLKNYLIHNAHPIYALGLEKTGISTERIPDLTEMSRKLEPYGWQAVPVSGFIPPAAFMEMQSLGLLPIACDMRSIEHLTYTPAPDIVHEAAGHAPILIDPEFSTYLKKYAQVARKSILNFQDLEVYEAIRELSDMKEDPSASEATIQACYTRLENAKTSAGDPSEAALLARMNWWTAEYGLVGTLEDPKIYGAGLMSSVGESRSCLEPSTAKIPFSLSCLNYNYDITEPQPQIFVASSFHQLTEEIEKLATTMAFRRGGREGVEKIIRAKTVNTIQLDSGIQISGKCVHVQPSYVPTQLGLAFFKFDGPCQLSYQDQQLSAEGILHDRARHPHGFSSPLGFWKNVEKNPTQLSVAELNAYGLVIGKRGRIETVSGVIVEGTVKSFVHRNQKLILITFYDCLVRFGVDVLFQPAWGDYDMAIGAEIPTVFGGPADRETYGEVEGFTVASVPVRPMTDDRKKLNELYLEIRHVRESILKNSDVPAAVEKISTPTASVARLNSILNQLAKDYPEDWLLRLEIFELGNLLKFQDSETMKNLKLSLVAFAQDHLHFRDSILDGLKIADKII